MRRCIAGRAFLLEPRAGLVRLALFFFFFYHLIRSMHLRRSFSFWHLSHATTRRTSMDGTQRQLFTSAAVPTLHGPAGCSALHCLACAALLYDELVFVDRPRCCVLPLLGTHIEGGGGSAAPGRKRSRRIPAYPLRRSVEGPLAFSPFAVRPGRHALGRGFAAGSCCCARRLRHGRACGNVV